jgi:hypothetical protein
MKLLLIPMLAASSLFGGQSVFLQNAGATLPVPNSGPFLALTSPGSYWIDFRVTSWSQPASGCQNILQLPGGSRPVQARICAVGGESPFSFDVGGDLTGGNMVTLGSPHIAITAVTATNPMVLTLARAPYPLTMAAGKTITIWGSSCPGMNANLNILAVSGNTLTIAYDGTGCTSYKASSGATYSQDFVFRYHRDMVLKEEIGESWNVDGTGYTVQEVPVLTPAAITLPGSWPVMIGPANVSYEYFRWYAGTIALNEQPPWGNTANAGGTVLADWEFEGNGQDSSANHMNLTFGSGAVYQATPVYPPACDAGAPQSWRAGTAPMLTSRSFPLDGGSQLFYNWQQIPSDQPGTPQQQVQWANARTATPTISGFIAGPLNFQLTVTDGSGLSSSCTVHDGAVATDDAGNVALADSRTANILGPLIQWGSPNVTWPFLDSSAKLWSDMLGANQGTLTPGMSISNYIDEWNIAAPGSVTISYGDLRVYGTGTTFQSSFCAGGKWVPANSYNSLVFWYPNAAIPGGFGRRIKPVGKCVSDTVVDLQITWSDDDGSSASTYNLDAPPGFSYTAGQTLTWRPTMSCAGGPTTVNVNGLGPVPLKKADGFTNPAPGDCAHSTSPTRGINLLYNGTVMIIQGTTDYSWYAWKTLPGTTAGMQYAAWGGGSFISWTGQITNINFYDNVVAFYAMYYRSGIDTYLKYARWLADKWWSMPYHDSGYGEFEWDARNEAVTGLYLRAIDQDNTLGSPGASPMWAGLKNETDNFYRQDIHRDSTNGEIVGDIRESGYSYSFVALCAAYFPDPVYAATCRADVNTAITQVLAKQRQSDGSWQGVYGSDVGVPNNWIGQTASGTVTVTPGSATVTLTGATWSASHFPAHFFTVGDPWNPATRDNGYYNATYIDATHIQLDRPYSDNCTPQCSGRYWIDGTTYCGFGTQPFMLGIMGEFFHQAYIALSMDPQYASPAAQAKSYLADATNWLTSTGVQESRRGLWYMAGAGICAGANPVDPNCTSPDIPQTRSLNAEVLGTLAFGYLDHPSAALKARIDDLYSAVYAKYPTDPGYDGIYLSSMDLAGFNYITQNPKWQGFFYGMGRNAAWPSARQGGLRPDNLVTAYITVRLGRRPDVAQFVVTVTDPTGATRPPVTCSALPCAVTVNRTLGNAIGRITYLAADGSVLGRSGPFVVPVE